VALRFDWAKEMLERKVIDLAIYIVCSKGGRRKAPSKCGQVRGKRGNKENPQLKTQVLGKKFEKGKKESSNGQSKARGT